MDLQRFELRVQHRQLQLRLLDSSDFEIGNHSKALLATYPRVSRVWRPFGAARPQGFVLPDSCCRFRRMEYHLPADRHLGSLSRDAYVTAELAEQ